MNTTELDCAGPRGNVSEGQESAPFVMMEDGPTGPSGQNLPGRASLRALSASELLAHPFPEQEPILAPWLLTQSLSMIHAWRGVGKTHVALNIAVAVATGGSFLRWTAPVARNVLYVDGEMAGHALQGRVRAIMAGKSLKAEQVDRLRFITPDAIDGPTPDLVTRSAQHAIETLAADADLIVLDNISTLFRANGAENEAESWRVPQEWALRLRKCGKAVLFIHHSGKNGGQRGSSKREDTLDVVIHLRHSPDYSATQGARFELHFEKFRPGFGEDAAPLDVAMTQTTVGEAAWTWAPIRSARTDAVLQLHSQGKTQRAIAAELGVSLTTVNRIVAKAREHAVANMTQPA